MVDLWCCDDLIVLSDRLHVIGVVNCRDFESKLEYYWQFEQKIPIFEPKLDDIFTSVLHAFTMASCVSQWSQNIQDGCTALTIAATEGRVANVLLLLKYGANIEHENKVIWGHRMAIDLKDNFGHLFSRIVLGMCI